MLFPVRPDPVPQRGLADPELAGHLRDSAGGFHYHARSFVTEFGRECLVLSCHLFSSFPVKILKDPQSGKREAPYSEILAWAGPVAAKAGFAGVVLSCEPTG